MYFCTENQVKEEEEETMWKVFEMIWCCDRFKRIRNDVSVYVKIRHNFWLSHENKFTVTLTDVLLSSVKEIYRLINKGISIIYLKLLLRKTDVVKTSIFQVEEIVLQISFWGHPTNADIIEFKTSCCNFKNTWEQKIA